MSYIAIDPVINEWVNKNAFAPFTHYKDAEVRSVTVVSATGRKFQIWIDQPSGEFVGVHAWDYKKQRQDWKVACDQLDITLDKVTETVKSWMDV